MPDGVRFTQPPTAAYIHIPFCRRRCYYCDFPISVVGDRPPLARTQTGTGFGTISTYIDWLQQEISATAPLGPALQTVFFGGGTPSLLTAAQLHQILDDLNQQFGIDAAAEISIEVDPDTVDRDRLQGYQAAGINRVSLGVQAFQSELLAACGRTHTRKDIDQAIELLDQVGITNFSLDLISGLPHQTMEQWQASLQTAITFAPTHLSVYDLTIEPGTAFDRWYQPGTQPLPTEAATAEMYRLAQRDLTAAGYQHYEVSNYAQPGYQCSHNRVYWENRSYYGFGMAAASYTQAQRFTRPRKRRDYYEWVKQYCTTGSLACPMTSASEALLDTLMLGLRLAEGLSLDRLQPFGDAVIAQVLACLAPYQAQGWVEIDRPIDRSSKTSTCQRIRLSDPEGFLFSNVVLSDLFEALG